MFKKLQKPNSKGFTIIEVMIVLAIAALILLIVLLAVPALQRSSRNTQRKNDISALAASVANYITNNNGTVPNNIAVASDTATVDCSGAIVTNCDSTDTNNETAKIGIFTTITPHAYAANLKAPNTNTVYYVPDYTCNDSNTSLGTANSRSAAFLYELEPTVYECQEQ